MTDKKGKILLVDDSSTARLFFKEKLSIYGYSISLAANKDECLKSLEQNRPDCIITDYEMPTVSGPQLCRILKRNPSYSDIPIILLTSKDQKEYLLEAINAGADDFMAKDLDIEIMTSRINAALRQSYLLKKHVELERYRVTHAMITTYNHEINTPLTVAISMLGDGHGEFTKERYEGATRALKQITSIVNIIEELSNPDINFEEYSAEHEMISLNKTKVS